MLMSRYAYDYSLSPARPTGWRGTLAGMTVVGTVIAVSAVSGALVTLQLFGAPTPAVVTPRLVAAAPVAPASQLVATRVGALAAKATPAPIARNHVAPPATVAAAPSTPAAPHAAPPVAAPASTASVAAVAQPAPAPIAESELTFAKGYALRRAVANGAVMRHGKVLVAAQGQLGRGAVKPKPRVHVARNNAGTADRRRADAYGMFQRFDRPDQFDFNRHQALAYGEQRSARRRSEPPPRQSGGFFGGLF